MTALAIILLSFISITIIALSLKLKIETSFTENRFSLKVYILSIELYNNRKKETKNNNGEQNKKTEKEKFSVLKFLIDNKEELTEDLKDVFRFIRKKVHARGFYLNLTFGLKDAADTGILNGGVWSFIGLIFPVVQSLIFFEDIPTINVNPVFNEYSFSVEYKGNYTLRVIHIIKLGIKLLLKYKKYKGGVNNGTASN